MILGPFSFIRLADGLFPAIGTACDLADSLENKMAFIACVYHGSVALALSPLFDIRFLFFAIMQKLQYKRSDCSAGIAVPMD